MANNKNFDSIKICKVNKMTINGPIFKFSIKKVKKNKLIIKGGVAIPPGVNNYGMKLVDLNKNSLTLPAGSNSIVYNKNVAKII